MRKYNFDTIFNHFKLAINEKPQILIAVSNPFQRISYCHQTIDNEAKTRKMH